MKRRNNPLPRAPRSARPVSIASVALGNYLPGIESMDDLEAFQALFTMAHQPGQSKKQLRLIELITMEFLAQRSLSIEVPFPNFMLLKKGDEVLGSFSVSYA